VAKIKLDKQEWVLGPFLASGTYGKVHLGESATGDPVAIKLMAMWPSTKRELPFDGAGRRSAEDRGIVVSSPDGLKSALEEFESYKLDSPAAGSGEPSPRQRFLGPVNR